MGNTEDKTLLLKSLQPSSRKEEIWFRFGTLALWGRAGKRLHVPQFCSSSNTLRCCWFFHVSLTSGGSSRCGWATELPLVLVRQRLSSSPYHIPDWPPRISESVSFTPRWFWAPTCHLARAGCLCLRGQRDMVALIHRAVNHEAQGGLWCHLGSIFWRVSANLLLSARNNGSWIGTSVM